MAKSSKEAAAALVPLATWLAQQPALPPEAVAGFRQWCGRDQWATPDAWAAQWAAWWQLPR